METRPAITLEHQASDRALIVAGFAVEFVKWVFVIWNYEALPDTIAVHFDSGGEVDGYGSKFTIIILAILGTLLFIGLETLTRFPHTFNYPVPIDQGNAPVLYRLQVRMLRYLNLVIVCLFAGIVYLMFQTAGGELPKGFVGLLGFGTALVFLPLIWYWVRLRRYVKKG